MSNLSTRALQLPTSAIRKLDAVVRARPEVRFHRLNIGQPDIPTPAALLSAAAAHQPRVVAYGPASGTAECREAAAHYHSTWSPGLGPEHVAVTTGGSEALLIALSITCDPGDEVLVPEPFYANFMGFATMAGAVIKPIHTSIETGFAFPPDEVLDTYVTDRTRVLLFSNPGNPTGAQYDRAQLERIVAWARRHQLWVVSDEVYRRIWFDRPPPSAFGLTDATDDVIVIDSMSKTYSACGLRLGFLMSHNLDVMALADRIGMARLGPQVLAQDVAIAALTLPESYYDAMRLTYKARVDALMRGVAGIEGVTAPRPQGAFYAMLRLPVDSAEGFARYLVEDFSEGGESLVVAPGPGFYATPGRGLDQIRLAAVVDEPTMARSMALLQTALDRYSAREHRAR
jgi:aspartate aminotransferase